MGIRGLLSSVKRNHVLKYLAYRIFKKHVVFAPENIMDDCILFKQETPFIKYQTNSFEKPINDLFNKWAFSGELEYLVHYQKKGLIEPLYGWYLNAKDEVIQKSLPYGEGHKTPGIDYIRYRRRKIIQEDTAVSIRYNWFNYWHFYNDILGQLYFLDKIKFDRAIPIVVPAKALQLSYVKFFFETEYAKKWNWIFQQDNTFIQLNSVYFCKSIPNIKEQFLYGTAIFKEKLSVKPADKKLFITRDPDRGRSLINLEEIHTLMKKNNFEIVECDALTIEQQIHIFSSGKIIVGIHGAGLTNIIYRYPNPCTVLEIFPPNLTPTHYYWLAKELNFEYRAILGSNSKNNSFYMDRQKLEAQLESLVDQPEPNPKDLRI